jgi:hypothetical protein
MERLVIVAKDISTLTGKSERYSRKVIRKLKVLYGKAQHQFVTLPELCEYLGLREADAAKRLR